RGHQVVDRGLNGRRRRLPKGGASGITTVRRIGQLEDEVVPRTFQLGVCLVEGDQVGECLRVCTARYRIRPVDVGVEIRRDVALELAEKRIELVGRRRQVDVSRVDDRRAL